MTDPTKIFVCFVIICGFSGIKYTRAINILGIVTSLSKSHSVFANSILNEYAHSGHSVTVLSPYEVSPKINHFHLNGLDKLKKQFTSNWNTRVDEYTAIFQLYEEGVHLSRSVINHESFKNLISSSLNVDVIIFDYDFNDALIGIVKYFKCPVLILSSSFPMLPLKRSIGLSYPLINVMFNKPVPSSGVISSLRAAAVNLYEELIVDFYYDKQQRLLYRQMVDDSSIDLVEILSKSVAKIFVNSLTRPILIPADVVDVAGLHIPDKSIFDYSVSNSLDQFIHSAEEGCIYVSLGANTDPATLPKDKIYKMFQAFNNRREKFIWAWNGNTSIFGPSSKFYIEKWLPQDDILRHRNIKAFVTNGGLLSLHEAIYHEIPVIGIPLTYEQSGNLEFMTKTGLGVKIELYNVTIESLAWALNEVLEHDSYRHRLASESDLMKSRPITPMKAVKYWIDHLYQHRHEIFTGTTKISTIGYYLSDVLVYLALLFILVLIFIVFIVLCKKLLYKRTMPAVIEQKQKLF